MRGSLQLVNDKVVEIRRPSRLRRSPCRLAGTIASLARSLFGWALPRRSTTELGRPGLRRSPRRLVCASAVAALVCLSALGEAASRTGAEPLGARIAAVHCTRRLPTVWAATEPEQPRPWPSVGRGPHDGLIMRWSRLTCCHTLIILQLGCWKESSILPGFLLLKDITFIIKSRPEFCVSHWLSVTVNTLQHRVYSLTFLNFRVWVWTQNNFSAALFAILEVCY